ncbi:MAG: IPT/TIG domain-containing protein [Candidatus Kapabacteria bacterium]|jgi:hypothetical protein|nr:IPT/TIG domain-containing protein [Candidatus Kapabacteria bacterium]
MKRLFTHFPHQHAVSRLNVTFLLLSCLLSLAPQRLRAQCSAAPIIDSVFVNNQTIGSSGIAEGGTGTNMIVYGRNLSGGDVVISGIRQTQYLREQSNDNRLVFILGSGQNGNLCVSTLCGQSNCVGFRFLRGCVRPEIYSITPNVIPCGGNGTTRLYVVGAALDNDVQYFLNGARLNRIGLIQSQDFSTFPPVSRDTAIVEVSNALCLNSGLIRATNMNPLCDTITSYDGQSRFVRFQTAAQPAPTITNFGPPEGGPLQEIRVEGENLTNISSVRIGRAPAAILSTNPLIIQPGAGSRTGRIEIQTLGGTAVSSTDFVFVAPPVITSVTPNIIGVGTPVYIRGQNLLRATVNFGGVQPLPSFQNLSDTLLIATIGTSGTITRVYPQLPASNVPVNVQGRGGLTVAPQRVVLVEAEYRRPMISLRPTNARGGASIDAVRQTLLLAERRATFLPPEAAQTGDIAIIRQNWNTDVTARIRIGYRDSAGREITVLRGFEITNAQREAIAFPIPPVEARLLPFFPPRETVTVNSQVNGLWGDLLPRTETPTRADTLRFGETFIPVPGVQSIFEFNRLDTSRISVRARWSDLVFPTNPDRINAADFPYIGRQGRRTMTVELLSSEVDEYDVDPINNVVRVVLDDAPIEAPLVVNPVQEQQMAGGSSGQVFIEAPSMPGTVALRATPNGGVIPNNIFYETNYLPLTYTVRSDNPAILTVSQGTGTADLGSKPLVRFSFAPTAISGSTAAVIITANNGRGGTATHQFIVRAQQGAPVITGVNPPSGRTGTVLTITGRDFGANPRVSFVGENGASINATPTASSDTQLTVQVPQGVETGRISITNSIATGASQNEFVIVRIPQISSFSPESAAQNAEILIRGTGFRGATQVLFGGVEAASFRIVSDTELRAVVSNRGASGVIFVRNPLDSGRSERTFTFLPAPVIQSYSPTTAGAGSTLVLTGLNFTGAGLSIQSVQLGSRNVSFSVVSATQMNVTVPDFGNDEMRDLPLQITTQGGSTTATTRFTYVPCPSIDTFSPSSGSYGAVLTITGTGLQAVTGVNVGGVPVLSWTLVSPTRISAVLGSVESGAVQLLAGRCMVNAPGLFTYQAPSRTLRFVLPNFPKIFPNERFDDSVTVLNLSSGVVAGSIGLSRTDGSFAVGMPNSFTLQRNQSVRLPLSFAPRSGGQKTATLSATVQGASATIDTTLSASAGIWQVLPADFDTVRTGRSTLRAVYVINRDTATARVEMVTMPSDGAFRIIGQPLRWLGRGDTTAIIVRCQPTVSQQRLQSLITVSGSNDDANAQVSAFARAPLASDIALEARITPDRDNVAPGQNITLRLEITNAQNFDRLRGNGYQWRSALRWTHGTLLAALNRNASQPQPQGQFSLARNSEPRNPMQRVNLPLQGLSASFTPPFTIASIPCGVYYSRDSASALELEELVFTHPDTRQRIFVEESQNGAFGRFTALTGGRLIQRSASAAVTVISPNPAQNMVSVKFSVPKETAVMLSLTDARGVLVQTLAEGWYLSGEHSIEFDASTIPSGSYMIMLHTEQERISRTLQLVR